MSGRPGLARLAETVRTFSTPEGAYDISGTVTAVAPGHCVVAGLSRHVRIGEFPYLSPWRHQQAGRGSQPWPG
jgi:flagellum-specific ATP synthase